MTPAVAAGTFSLNGGSGGAAGAAPFLGSDGGAGGAMGGNGGDGGEDKEHPSRGVAVGHTAVHSMAVCPPVWRARIRLGASEPSAL